MASLPPYGGSGLKSHMVGVENDQEEVSLHTEGVD